MGEWFGSLSRLDLNLIAVHGVGMRNVRFPRGAECSLMRFA